MVELTASVKSVREIIAGSLKYLVTGALLVLSGVGLMLTFSSYVATNNKSEQDAQADRFHFNQALQIEGISHVRMGEQGVASRLNADTLVIKPRRVFLFNIRSVNEAVLTNASIETFLSGYSSEDKTQTVGIDTALPLGKSGYGGKGGKHAFGLITRVVVKRLLWEVTVADQQVMTLVAEKAVLDPKTGRTIFLNASLKQILENKLIVADRMLLDRQLKTISIPGEYKQYNSQDIITGTTAHIDLDTFLAKR